MNQVAGDCLPHGANRELVSQTLANAAYGGKEPTRMKINHGERVQSTTHDKNPLRGTRAIAGLGLAASLLLSGCATTEAAPPKETTTKSAETEAPAPELTPEEQRALDFYNMPAPEKFDEWEALTLDEFNALPPEDRVEYLLYMNRDGILQSEQWVAATGNPNEATPESIHADNTGQEIHTSLRRNLTASTERHEMNWAAQVAGEIPGGEPDDEWVHPDYSDLQRQKLVAGVYLYPINNAIAEEWRNGAVSTWSGSNAAYFVHNNAPIIIDEEVTDRSANYTITDQWGVERAAVDITYREPDGKVTKSTQVLVETPSGSAWMIVQ